jgi:hypothetical protein
MTFILYQCVIYKILIPQGKGDLDITVNGNRIFFAWVISELFYIANKALFMFIHRRIRWSVVADFKILTAADPRFHA